MKPQYWQDRDFVDLEPVFGRMDHLFEPLVTEINEYPLARESGYVRIESKPEYESLETKNIWSTDFDSTLKSQWSGDWPLFDSRITLVKNTEKKGVYFPGKPWTQTEQYFEKTWEILKKLPIEHYYRTIIIIGSPNNQLQKHEDWLHTENPITSGKIHGLFINPCNNRPFYYIEPGTNRKVYTNSSIFTINQNLTHGISAVPHHSAMIRLFCKLDDDFCDANGIYRATGGIEYLRNKK